MNVFTGSYPQIFLSIPTRESNSVFHVNLQTKPWSAVLSEPRSAAYTAASELKFTVVTDQADCNKPATTRRKESGERVLYLHKLLCFLTSSSAWFCFTHFKARDLCPILKKPDHWRRKIFVSFGESVHLSV